MPTEILARNMKPGLIYRVVRGTKCRTLQAGDRIRIGPNADLDLLLAGGGGWMENSSPWLRRIKATVRLDTEYYVDRIASAESEIKEFRRILFDEADDAP